MILRRRAAADGAARAYAKAALPRRDTPWREARYCVVDLELSGLDPKVHEIVSFCAIPVDQGVLRLSGAVHGLARPTRPVPEEAIRIHGIDVVRRISTQPVINSPEFPLGDRPEKPVVIRKVHIQAHPGDPARMTR